MSFPTPPDDRGYSRYCSACSNEIHHCNMYGMGTCPTCGFEDRPAQEDNTARAAEWRKEHSMTVDLHPLGTDASNLIDAIRDGRWDQYLSEIVQAVGNRRETRREALLAQVHEVYGPNYTIKAER